MAELKNIRVREAKERDLGLFRKLWMGLLEEQEAKGSTTKATKKTLAVFENIFQAYVEGKYEGIVLFIADKAVLMWGDSGVGIDYSKGKIASGWGTYVALDARKKGLSKAIRKRGNELLKEKGFSGITGHVIKDDEAAEKSVSKDFEITGSTVLHLFEE